MDRVVHASEPVYVCVVAVLLLWISLQFLFSVIAEVRIMDMQTSSVS